MNPKTELPEHIKCRSSLDFRYVLYEYARHVVCKIGIKSGIQYRLWYKEFKPAGFPLRPDKCVQWGDSWVDWSTFLNRKNYWAPDLPYAVKPSDLIPYWEAVGLVQSMGLRSVAEYKEAFDSGLVPKGIPRSPHKRYARFYNNGGWKFFLGKKLKHRVEGARNMEHYMVLYVGTGRSSNILSVMIWKKGRRGMLNMISERGLSVVRVYRWYDEVSDEVFNLMDSYGKKQDDVTWMYSNVNDILFELGTYMEVVRG